MNNIKIGNVCRVISARSHVPPQLGDLVLITGKVLDLILEGKNLRTDKKHHYNYHELEIIA
jgi:hypothetical protein